MRRRLFFALSSATVVLSAGAVAVSCALEPFATPSGSTSTSAGTGGTGGASGSGLDPATFASPPLSCVYSCSPGTCAEYDTPYVCPSLGAWAAIPHADTCPAWDGKFPDPAPGACKATEPSGDAIKYPGADADNPATLIMPGGRRLTPAGAEWVFKDGSSQVSNILPIPNTGFLVTIDVGYADHIVRVIDPSKLAMAADPVVAQVNFPDPETLNQGIAFSAPDRLFVARADGKIQVITLDVATGALKRDDTRSIVLPDSPKGKDGKSYYASGVAVSADNTKLFVTGVRDSRLLVIDVAHAAKTYGTLLGMAELDSGETYAVYTDPHDVATHFAYVSMWQSRAVREVDVSNPAQPKVTRTFAVDKDPQGIVFLDARWMAVSNDLGDTISLIDRVSGTVTPTRIDASLTVNGVEPSMLAWDAATKRLYVTEAGVNALGAYDVDLSKAPPTLTSVGRLPTQWWPSAVVVQGDSSVVVTSLMGRGTGPAAPTAGYDPLKGGIQWLAKPAIPELQAGDATVQANRRVADLLGHPTVECGTGSDDFPIPSTNTGKRSPVIEHVFFVVRENKSYDALFGDLPGGKGNPKGTLATKDQMDVIWNNIRRIAQTFSRSDNYYTAAFISNQGHLWATHGRSSDFNEREWPVTGYGRGTRGDPDSGGVTDVSRPDEGSMFDWLGENGLVYHILGEIVGGPKEIPPGQIPIDTNYPGGFIQSIGYPDIEKACYVAGRVRVMCNIGDVVYMTLPNDHTRGVGIGTPTPQTMFAVNDEATGILVDAISHSPIWDKSLIIITEDDPAQGGESVDYHRTVFTMVSPWVKRGYVSHTQIDTSTVHKLIAHIFAIPYHNVQTADSGLPLDMFTSTPDRTPYEYSKRTFQPTCPMTASAAEQKLTESWDMDDDEVDQQPELGAQIQRWMKGEQLEVLPPELEAEVERRLAAKKQRDGAK